MLHRSQFFLAIIALISFAKIAEASYSVDVRSGKTKCFIIKTPSDHESKFSGHFELLDEDIDAADTLLFTIKSLDHAGDLGGHASNHVYPEYQTFAEDEGSFNFYAMGAYQLCIENKHPESKLGAFEKITVGFSVRVKTADHLHGDTTGPETQSASRISDLADDFIVGLEELRDHFEMMTERERKHRDVTEKTFRNVWLWTMIEKIVLVLVSVGQVMYIKYYMNLKRGGF